MKITLVVILCMCSSVAHAQFYPDYNSNSSFQMRQMQVDMDRMRRQQQEMQDELDHARTKCMSRNIQEGRIGVCP